MGRRERGTGGAAIEPVYEGPHVLTELLARAGSAFSATEVASRFRHAQSHGAGRDVAVPALFEGEPRFDSPDDARRLYANLFGLWGRVKAGGDAEGDPPVAPAAAAPMPAAVATAAPTLPERGSEPGPRLPAELVDAVWRSLDALPARERRRRQDVYDAAQPDLSTWAASLSLPDVGSVAAQDLVFEIWSMYDQAYGDRLRAVTYPELRALEAEPPAIDLEQPAVAAYVAEVLELVADEEPGFDRAAQAQVERVAAAVVAALDACVRHRDGEAAL